MIKYAAYIHALEVSATAAGQIVTVAAPAAGSYNIHANLGGANFWCPISDVNGNALCGVSPSPINPLPQYTQVGGNLKGVYYDMAHYQDATVTAAKSSAGTLFNVNYAATGLFANLLSGLDTIGVMSYDLDDGYTNNAMIDPATQSKVNSAWCMGYLGVNGQPMHLSSRDPGTPGYTTPDCSIGMQNAAIVQSYRQDVLANDTTTTLAFGLESGLPNYPVNIDGALPGGGDSDDARNSPYYRWNDWTMIFDIPMVSTFPSTDFTAQGAPNFAFYTARQLDPANNSVADNHSQFLVLNNDLFTNMQNAGATGLIMWSLNNADYNGHLAAGSWDQSQFAANPATPIFADDAGKWGYSAGILQDIFKYAASPEQILTAAYQAGY